jgi:hypothetical protein
MRRVLVAAGAAAVLVSGLLPWLRFERSELSGFRLAELVASVADEYRLGPPSWLGIAWYALPLCALVAWFALVLARPMRVRPLLHLVLGGAMTALSVGFVVAAHRTVGVEPGPVVSVAGSLAVVAGAVLALKAPPSARRQY